LFRSELFGRWRSGELEVEVMAGLHVRARGGWREVRPQGRVAVPVGGASLFVPPHGELVDILRGFGRPKDLVRAAALAALDPPFGLDAGPAAR
jgi:hypothetical protein